MEDLLQQFNTLACDPKISTVKFCYAGDSFFSVSSDRLETSPFLRFLCELVEKGFNKFPDDPKLVEAWRDAPRKIQVKPIVEKGKSLKLPCQSCQKNFTAVLTELEEEDEDATYAELYLSIVELREVCTRDSGCCHIDEKYPLFIPKYEQSVRNPYPRRVAKLRELEEEQISPSPTDLVFFVYEFWDEEEQDMELCVRVYEENIPTTQCSKYAVLGWALTERMTIEDFERLRPNDKDGIAFIKKHFK